MIRNQSLQEKLEIRKATEKSKMINMEEKIGNIVATTMWEAMISAMLIIRLETWVAFKMLKEDIAAETEGAKDESKRRKQSSKGTTAVQQVDKEQIRNTGSEHCRVN